MRTIDWGMEAESMAAEARSRVSGEVAQPGPLAVRAAGSAGAGWRSADAEAAKSGGGGGSGDR